MSATAATLSVPLRVRPRSRATLHALRGADADAGVRRLVAARAGGRPRLAVLAREFLRRGAHERLGFRSLGDFARERLGVGARVFREWARVWEALTHLPALRASVLSGDVSWSVARMVVGIATPETDEDCAATVQHRTVRAVGAMLRALPAEAAPPQETDAAAKSAVYVTAPLPAEALPRWHYALELARRVAGEALPVWACAEAIAAETLAAVGDDTSDTQHPCVSGDFPGTPGRRTQGGREAPPDGQEHGLRHAAFPLVRWLHGPPSRSDGALLALAQWAHDASAHALDDALRREHSALQHVDADLGALLREILERGLYRELGFGRFDRYVEERVDVSPRTARRWVRLARGDADTREVASAFREARVTGLQAEVVLASAVGNAPAWLARAASLTLRGLEDVAREAAATGALEPATLRFRAPESVASVFFAAIEAARRRLERSSTTRGAVGSPAALLWMIEHAITAWQQQGAQFRDYADFGRDGWRCTAPGCTARRNLQSHHIVFRSHGGPDVPSNRTTLCAFHHLRGVHGGTIACKGHAPDSLVFSLGLRPGGGAPLLRARSGDVLVA